MKKYRSLGQSKVDSRFFGVSSNFFGKYDFFQCYSFGVGVKTQIAIERGWLWNVCFLGNKTMGLSDKLTVGEPNRVASNLLDP